jgi:hypothetical protein
VVPASAVAAVTTPEGQNYAAGSGGTKYYKQAYLGNSTN